MIPFALPLLFAPGLGGRLAARHASPVLLTFGLSLVALGNALSAAVVWAGAGYWMVAVGMLVTGSGAGILNGKTVKAQLSTVPPERAGMASGIAGTTRFAGIILALAGLGAVLAVVTEDSLHRHGGSASLESRRRLARSRPARSSAVMAMARSPPCHFRCGDARRRRSRRRGSGVRRRCSPEPPSWR